MSDVSGQNRLGDEPSPYLRQHADNPVNWQPWDDEALAEAKERDVPIFLSVGYAACHWCHVMEDESFQDEAVAEILNTEYVPIKVDREERPDIDRIYQTICQLVTRSGGWPLSVWMTPDGRPFYVGTYFPPTDRHGRPGFSELLQGLAETWENDREEIENRADQWMQAIKGEVEDVAAPGDPPAADVLESAALSAVRSADSEHGGFSTSGPKFPQPTRLDILLRAYHRTGRAEFGSVARKTLDAMATRGMYDQVGGGFHRYATDREWVVPHFEKMLYDNAELPRVYLAGYQLTGADRYARVVQETLEFVERELGHPSGGFYSTLDAQSERDGEETEGGFYVWTPDEVTAVLEDEVTAEVFCDRFGVTDAGNFEGKTVLTITATVESLADEYDLSPDEVTARLGEARSAIFEARDERPRPARDEKILAGWNGLAISAFAEAGLVLDETYLERATRALEFIKDTLWDGTRLRRRVKDGNVAIDGYLEDYAFLARGAFNLYEATGELQHLEFALELGRVIKNEFWESEPGALYFTPKSGEKLVARPQELTDQSTPSSAGVAIDMLLILSHFDTEAGFDAIVEQALESYGSRVKSNPLQHASLVLAADRYRHGSHELTIVAEDLPEEWRRRIADAYLPGRILSLRPPDVDSWLDQLGVTETPPIWAGRDADGEPTIYACRDFSCSPPTTSIEEALAWFDSDQEPMNLDTET